MSIPSITTATTLCDTARGSGVSDEITRSLLTPQGKVRKPALQLLRHEE